MGILFVLIILGIAIWLSLVLFAIAIPVCPRILRIAQKLVCPKGLKLIVQKETQLNQIPGQKAINIYYEDQNGIIHNVAEKTLLCFWLILFSISLIISTFGLLAFKNSL